MRRHTIPSADRSHAAFVACRAAMRAREGGASESEARAAYDAAYADTMRDGKVAA